MTKRGLPGREQILKRMWKLANAGAGDAVRLACFPETEWGELGKLDLDALTEFKRGANGVIELKFADRARLLERLRETRHADLAAGFTTAGPHRADLLVQIRGLSARSYGSQGQQRSAVLALKLAEASVLREVTGEQPVALLDDVMSELDLSRQDYILNHIHGWQVFITCCDPGAVRRLDGGRAFRMQDGILTPDG